MINHKRNFGIECQVPDETVHFQFADPESAKYVWRMCVHQVNNMSHILVYLTIFCQLHILHSLKWQDDCHITEEGTKILSQYSNWQAEI